MIYTLETLKWDKISLKLYMKLLTKTTDYDETIKLANKLTGKYIFILLN